MSASHPSGLGPARLWIMLFCALFSVALVHGAEGASSHPPHGDATATMVAHQDHSPAEHLAAAAHPVAHAEESADTATLPDGSQPHQHTECLALAALFALVLLLMCPPAPLHPALTPAPAWSTVLSWLRRGPEPRRHPRRLLTELSVLQV